LAQSNCQGVKDRVVLITGAGQGIGRAYAHHFARLGAIAVIAELDAASGRRVAEEILSEGGRALALQTDVTAAPSVEASVAHVVRQYGRLDVLINNAAIFSTLTRRRFEDIPLSEWEQALRVNVLGCVLCSRAVLAPMRAANWGHIINISSSSVPLGLPGFAHYLTSKAAIIGLTRATAREFGADNITVNAVLPGMTETEVVNAARTDASRQRAVGMQSIRRIQTPGDLLGALTFLASPASDFVTGQSIVVDGGAAFL
jgi:NAD(P)-dependent dehydrogenase (short-subunit alcohol dehydrogenase family)